jgi:hypothetical protein
MIFRRRLAAFQSTRATFLKLNNVQGDAKRKENLTPAPPPSFVSMEASGISTSRMKTLAGFVEIPILDNAGLGPRIM